MKPRRSSWRKASMIACIDLWLWRRFIEGTRTPFRKKRQRKEQAIKFFCKTSPIRAFHVGRVDQDWEKIGGMALAERVWDLPGADLSLLNKSPTQSIATIIRARGRSAFNRALRRFGAAVNKTKCLPKKLFV